MKRNVNNKKSYKKRNNIENENKKRKNWEKPKMKNEFKKEWEEKEKKKRKKFKWIIEKIELTLKKIDFQREGKGNYLTLLTHSL